MFDVPDGIKRGPGLWKLNNSLLDDRNYCDLINNLIQDHLAFLYVFESFQDWWEFLKQSITDESISFSRRKRKQLSRDRVFLTNKLTSLRQLLVGVDSFVADSIVDIESRLKALLRPS